MKYPTVTVEDGFVAVGDDVPVGIFGNLPPNGDYQLAPADSLVIERDAERESKPFVYQGDWGYTDEPKGWERFTVMAHGEEAGGFKEIALGELLDALAAAQKEDGDGE